MTPDSPNTQESTTRGLWLAWATLLLFLSLNLPLFLCLPLYNDASHHDLCARNVLEGGVHYRDLFDTNLPGIIWIHMAIRALLGWRSEVLRLADFVIVTASVWLLVRWLGTRGLSRTAQVWTALALFLFYFSTEEVSHCQRDVWMLLPALLALGLRRQQVEALLAEAVSGRHLLLRAGA